MKSKITDRGQITIPKALRERYGLREGMEVEFVEEGGSLRLAKSGQGTHPVDSVCGILEGTETTDEYLEEIRGR